MGIRMSSKEIGASSRTASGVRGINLADGDSVVAALPIHNTDDKLAIFTQAGTGKKFALSELPIQKRAGKGLQCIKNEEIAAAALVSDDDLLLICGDKSSICLSAADITSGARGPSIGTQIIKGKKLKSVSKT
jgi:DNA gyrase subunit A